TGVELAVFGVLLEHHNWRDGYARPGFDRIARETRRPERSVRRAVRRLETDGYLVIWRPQEEKRDGRSTNRYAFPDLCRDVAGGTSKSPQGGQNALLGGTAVSPEPSSEPMKVNQK